MINTDEPQASAEGSIPAAPQSQHPAYPYPQPHPQSHPHSHPHSLIASHALTHPQSQGSEQPSVLPSVLQQPHSQPRQPLPQPHQLYKGLEKPHDHPSLNCWELPYIWAAITRFIPIVQHELLDGVRELEEALTASPGTVHPTVHLVMEHIVRIFKPKMSNTDPDALAKQIQLQLSDIKHWPEEVVDQPSGAVVEDRPLKDGKSFWEAGWREKVSVMRHLVDLSLSTPQIKDMIEKNYRVSTVERHRKRRDDPKDNALVLPPVGEDSKRQRLWVLDDNPRVYISGNPWKKSTTMTAVTDTMEDVVALANSYAMSSYQSEMKAMEVAQTDKSLWKQLMNNAKKERDLAESLAGQRQGAFLRRCEAEESRIAPMKRRRKEEAEESEKHLSQHPEERRNVGYGDGEQTLKKEYEDPRREDREDREDNHIDIKKEEFAIRDKDDDGREPEVEEPDGRRSRRQTHNRSQTPSKQGTPSDKSTRSSSRLNTNQDIFNSHPRTTSKLKMLPRVFIDWNIDGEYAGRLIFELYSDKVPKTAENFKSLCTGERGSDEATGNSLTYKNSISHRIIKGFMIQFGDITNGNGTGGLSIYGGKFEDENFDLKHTKRGQLSMANAGPDTNGSQVFVTFCPCPHLDGRHVVFGELAKGKGLLRRLENTQTVDNDFPAVDVRIVDSGLVREGEDDGVPPLSIGDHEDYPEDDDAETEKPEVALEIAQSIKDKGAQCFKQQDVEGALDQWEKAIRYLDVNPVLPEETANVTKALYSTTRVQLYLNASLAALKLNKAPVAESMATKAIRVPPTKSQDIAKGLYRRALAKSARKNDAGALDDLHYAIKVEPQDKNIHSQIATLEKKVEGFKLKEKQVYSKMDDHVEPQRDTRWEKLESRIKNLAEDDGFEIESDLPRLARAIQAAFEYYEDVIPDTIYKFFTQQPHKSQLYASLVLLLSISFDNQDNQDAGIVGQKVLDHCLIRWKDALESRRWMEMRIGTNFFANLVPALISPESFYETINTFVKVLEEPGVSSLRAERAIECASEALIYASSFLTTQSKERYEGFVNRIEQYVQNEEINDTRLLLYPWVNLPKNNSRNKVDNCVDPIQIYIKTLRSLSESEFKDPKLPLFDIEEVLPTVREVDPALRTELPSLLVPADDYNTTSRPNSELSRWKLHIIEDDTVPSPDSGDGVIVYSVLRDMITLYNRNRIDCAKILMDVPTFFQGNLFNVDGYSLESTLVSTILSELLTLPEPKHPKLYYSSLITELCKLSPKTVAPALGRSIRKIYGFIGEGLDVEIIMRFSEWFATHLSNFGFNWVWKEWIPDLDLPDNHPKRMFIKRVIELEIRLSYFDRINQTLPEALLNKAGMVVSPMPNFIYANEEHPYNATTTSVMDSMRNKITSDAMIKNIVKIEEDLKENPSLPQSGNSAKKVSRDIATQCLLNVGSRSFSHFLNVIEKYIEVIKYLTADKDSRIDLLRSVGRFWVRNSQMKKIIVDKLLQYRLIEPTDVVQWLFNPNDPEFPSEVDDTVYQIGWSDLNFGDLLKTALNKVNTRVNQQYQKLVETKKNDEEVASIAKARNMEIDNEDETTKEEERRDYSQLQLTFDNLNREQRECFVLLVQAFVEALEGVDSISDKSIEEYTDQDWDKWLSWSWYQAFLREYWPSISETVETIQSMSHVHSIAKEGFGPNSNLYDEHRPSYSEEAVSEIIRNIPNKPARVLELGSGTGIFTRALLSHTTTEIQSLIAAEPSEDMRKTCADSLNNDIVKGREVEVIEGTFEHIEAEDDLFDIVIIAQAYHWCADYDKSLKELKRVMKPHGKLALTWNMEDKYNKKWVANARNIYEKYDVGTPQYRLGEWKALFDTDAYRSYYKGVDYNKYLRHLPLSLQGYKDRQSTKSFINILPIKEKEELLEHLAQFIASQPDVDWIEKDKGTFYIPYSTDLFIIHLK
ncbi:hypothetical protein E3P81_00357 [Wallemia ichthyophaga]|nr:hypothetical protein E3P97_00359 [Wallemia ichthyophaga]TIB35469.1 hypothetical protein E3P85_00359 [Wallemia ichthyophaga]TIB50609.1 hypothetical protein E3P82_00359 [Wallemia ichthyophaga]TIB54194.1 hypothetical protein E3P81_00357 [Wallemia ichthyophaga]TIB56789.1 hypothetical protein E3P80_00359 [Wallemia ichthyophaga]